MKYILAILFLVAGFFLNTTSLTHAANKTYCNNSNQTGCLQPITVSFFSYCPTNTSRKIEMTFNNPNSVDAPRLITLYRNGQQYSEDSGVAVPGESTITYGPLEIAQWKAVVHWENKLFGQETFDLACIN